MPSHHEGLQGFSERLAHLIQQEGGRAKKQAFARKIGVKPQQLSRYLKHPRCVEGVVLTWNGCK
jgi:hypothetical protein